MPQSTAHDVGSPASQIAVGARRSASGIRTATANMVIVTAFTIAALYYGKAVFIPLAIAVLVAFVLSPIVAILRRLKLPRIVAAPTVVVATFALLFSIGVVLSDQIRDLAEDLPRFEYSLREKVRAIRSTLTANPAMERAAETLKDLQSELKGDGDKQQPKAPSTDSSRLAPGRLTPADPPAAQTPDTTPIPVEIHYPNPSPIDNLLSLLSPLIEPAAMLAIVVVLVLFMLMQKEELRDRFIRLTGATDMQRATAAMTDAGQRLSRFFLTMTVLNVAYGLFISLALWALGVPAPVLWGILAALMRFVPIVGSFIAAAFPVVLAAAVTPGWTTMLLALGLFVISEALMGQVIEPLLQGKSTGLSPFAILIATAFWTLLWGPVGLLLAIPITLCLVVIGQHVDNLNFIHVMLGDEPAFSLQERFYQRTLAGDATEITELAEQHIKERPLSCYYSEIAIGALRLAQIDADGALIETEHMERIERTVETMVDNLWEYPDQFPKHTKQSGDAVAGGDDLDEYNDVDCRIIGTADLPVLQQHELADSWRQPNSVLCVAAHTPIDRAAAHVLSQVLYAHGISAEVVDGGNIQEHGSEHSAKRARLICIVSVSAQLAPTRYLARRVARRHKDAALFIVLLGADEEKAAAFADSYPEMSERVIVNLRDTTSRIIAHVSSSNLARADRTAQISVLA